MKVSRTLVVLVTTCLLVGDILAEQKLLVKHERKRATRLTRQTSADQMVQNILQWLQGVYAQQSRRSRSFSDELGTAYSPYDFASSRTDDAFRQENLREYLPPSVTQKPRPFEPKPEGDGTDEHGNFIETGYPPAMTPQPPFPLYTNPPSEGYPSSTLPPSSPAPGPIGPSTLPPPSPPTGFQTQPPQPPAFTGYPTEGPYPYHPSVGTTERPGYPTQPPIETERPIVPGFPTSPPYIPPQEPTGYPTVKPEVPEVPGFPTQAPPGLIHTLPPQEEVTPEFPGFPTAPPPGVTPGFPTVPPPGVTPGFPTAPPPGVTPSVPTALPPSITPGFPTQPSTGYPTYPTQSVDVTTGKPEVTTPAVPAEKGTPGPITEEDLRHPPHIHAIEVECAKDMMTINIEFNREFDGVIYSKGYYHMPECRYVNEDSGQTKYTFTVNLNMCGTEFINAFDTQGQSYLENILVIQNEAGIQEIWDTVRSVRCLWEGNLKEQLSVSLMVGMLTQEIVTFSGDTAMAKLDVVLGRGPFGQAASGLVKIGEQMTLVVSVSGDPGFDIQVKDCRATDSTGDNIVPLTDDNGCVLKPKLFGAFQKTRNTGNTGASIIAFAYFNAFKFPDVMDIMIECNIELCKTDCEMCPNPEQALEPAKRRRRDLYSFNSTLHDGVMMGKHLRVVLPEDLTAIAALNDAVCMSTPGFVFTSSVLISLLTASCLFSAYLWLKANRQRVVKF